MPDEIDAGGVSVVLVHGGGHEILEGCLASLGPTLPAAGEVIVVDNASPDGSVALLRGRWPAVRVVEMGRNAGFAAGCNRGAELATHDPVVFLNNDTLVAEGWLEPLLECLRERPRVAIAGGVALFRDDPSIVNSAGVRVALSGAAVDAGFGLRRSSVAVEDREVAAVSGVCMAVDRAWFLHSGGFDESFFMYFEDVELSLRAWLEGREVRLASKSSVLHAFGATSGRRSSPFRYRLASRNRLLIAFKLWPLSLVPAAFAASLLQDLLVVLHLVWRGDRRGALVAARSKARGTAQALSLLPATARFRRGFSARAQRSVVDLYRRGLIDGAGAALREFARMRRV